MSIAPDGQNPSSGGYPKGYKKPNVTRPPKGYHEDGTRRRKRRVRKRRVPIPPLNPRTGYGKGIA